MASKNVSHATVNRGVVQGNLVSEPRHPPCPCSHSGTHACPPYRLRRGTLVLTFRFTSGAECQLALM